MYARDHELLRNGSAMLKFKKRDDPDGEAEPEFVSQILEVPVVKASNDDGIALFKK